ncbi:glycosyltransferase family 2 protein [Oryzomonas sagensis]|uniref:Glycosyltransferase family 2 protein n=1 Tax=Oryzomonas sagensis TaxID=2603857 RepID=A0ABQ6TU81_9BACT|nr:glycosyltransferase family 2 protein [Oryzomonas sagensis]KAB0672329.1 glycosyltransferase family 2 protein [Oryzomonas sagensis]
MSTACQFSIIIPNWNGIEHIEECLLSVGQQRFKDFDVVVVDNASTDRSVQFIHEHFPGVKVVALADNLGFSAGVNCGIRASIGKFVVLLNNDTVVAPNWLENLVKAIQDNPNVSIFASKLLNYYDRGVIDSAGDALDLSLGPYKIGEYQPKGQFSESRFIFGACGGGGCYRREIFDQIGAFDEDFFAYFEDIDLSFRANWAGIRTLFVPDAVIYHKIAATSGASSANKDRFDILRRRNFIFLVIKNYSLPLLARHLPFIMLGHVAQFLRNISQRRWRVAFETQWMILNGLSGMMRKRRQILAARMIGTGEMRELCSSKYGGTVAFLRKKLGSGRG